MPAIESSRKEGLAKSLIETRSQAGSEPMNPQIFCLNVPANAFVEAQNQVHRTGHGVMAERMNFLRDVERGALVTHEGWSNARHGPDKIVEGRPVQCKYYATARAGIASCFGPDGKFLYAENTIIELPIEQLPEGAEILAKRLGLPKEEAAKLLRGGIPRRDALDLCKPLTRASLSYDLRLASVTFWSAFFLAGSIGAARCVVRGETGLLLKYSKCALLGGLNAGATHLLAAQLGKSGIEAVVTPLTKRAATALGPRTNSLIGLAAGSKSGINQTTKILNGALLANVAATTVQALPDIYRLGAGQLTTADALGRLANRSKKIAVQQIAGQIGAVAGALVGAAITGGAGTKVGKVSGRIAGEMFLPKLAAFLADLVFGMPKEEERFIRNALADVALEVAIERQLSEENFDKYLGNLAPALKGFIKKYKIHDAKFYNGLFRDLCEFAAQPFAEKQLQDMANSMTA